MVREKDKIAIAILFAVFAIRLFFVYPSISDENTYFNMARNMVENGLTPYRDFFHAHPPLQLYSLSLLFKLFGASLFVGKLFPLIFSTASAYIIYKISCKFTKKPFFALLLFLLSPQYLCFGNVAYGMWPSLFFSLLSFYLLLEKKPWAGIFITVAFFFRYLSFLFLPVLVFFAFREKKLKEFMLYSGASFALLFLLFFGLFGGDFISNTIEYHLSSKMGDYSSSRLYRDFFTMQGPLIFVSLVFLVMSRLSKKEILIPLLMDVLVLLLFKVAFYHYFLFAFALYVIFLPEFFKDEKLIFCIFIILFLVSNRLSVLFYNTENTDMTNALRSLEGREIDSLWGYPIMANYVSFARKIPVAGNEFDADEIRVDLNPSILQEIVEESPDLILEANYSMPYHSFMSEGYTMIYSSSSNIVRFFMFLKD